jgi:16S rRNA (cytosine967-C5)-methyltransferase
MLPLSLQLQATAKAVAFVISGRSLNDALTDGSIVKPELRSGVQALSFVVLRHFGMARVLRDLLADRMPAPPVDALLCTALALLVAEPDSGASYTEFTLVNQAVEAAKAHSKTRTSASFMNALLRRFLRERESLTEQALQSEQAKYNHPTWWIDQLRQERPRQWQDILAANQIKPALSLRVNLAKTTLVDYTKKLDEQGITWMSADLVLRKANQNEACENDVCGLILQDSPSVQSLPEYAEGGFSVQDLAAQGAAQQLLSDAYLAKLVVRAKEGQIVRILDACAAPGGKTTHLIERLLVAFAKAGLPVITSEDWGKYFEVVAVEFDVKRAKRIHENLSRLKQRATVKIADVAALASWWDGAPFDAVLLDAPCTASGIVRRHPDVRWLRRASDSEQLARTQLAMLKALWPVLRQEGRLLYATCSVFEAEGARVVRDFLQAEASANQLDSNGLWLPTLPLPTTDGFYDALFEKTVT